MEQLLGIVIAGGACIAFGGLCVVSLLWAIDGFVDEMNVIWKLVPLGIGAATYLGFIVCCYGLYLVVSCGFFGASYPDSHVTGTLARQLMLACLGLAVVTMIIAQVRENRRYLY